MDFRNLIQFLEENKFDFLEDLYNFSLKEEDEIKNSNLNPAKKMGKKKYVQIEFFRNILDIIINAYLKYNMKEQSLKIFNIIKEKKIFNKINKLFFDFPFCNLYQIIYNQIFEI